MNELPRTFVIAKSTGTHADVFATVGLAKLLSSGAAHVRITQSESTFTLNADGVELSTLSVSPGYPFLKTNEKVTVPHGAFDPVDYKAEKAKADRIRDLRQDKKLKALDEATRQAIERDKPRPDWRLLQLLNILQGFKTTNRVHSLIVQMKTGAFQQKMAAAIAALADGDPSNWDWGATSVQLFTPIAAKGYSRLKPDSTDRNDRSKDEWTDPFIEWLRYQGYFSIACPFFWKEDVRLLCPVPRDISIGALCTAATELRAAGVRGGPAKLDSLATLKLAEILVRHSEEYHDADVDVFDDFPLKGKTPADAISGITVTHYQSLGNAKAVSAMSMIALPGWFRLDTAERARKFLDILIEHQTALRTLQDDYSDEMGLLIIYRRFLQTRGEPAAEMLIDFLARYGAMLLGAWQEGRRLRAFRTDNLREILMATNPRLSDVLSNSGFLAIAAAVRRATVNAQALKAMNRPDYREIRYDLLPELRRKSSLSGTQPLIQAVSDFISKYNVENARRREMNKSAPRNVTTDEFVAFVALLETAGAPTVGAMLCAYGSCREPRDEEVASDPASEDQR